MQNAGVNSLHVCLVILQVQHVFAVLHKTGGGTRRTALTELRQEYERSVKFNGKI